jgi:hypothetical protein
MASTALPLVAEGWIMHALTSKLTLLCGGMILLCLVLLTLLLRATIRLGRAAKRQEKSPGSGVPSLEAQTGHLKTQNSGLRTPDSRLSALLADTRGTTSIEFALVFPILLVLSLILVQSMMMMAGNMYVHYAAFQAARHATIEVPQDYTGDGDLTANQYSSGTGSIKHERIRRAAYMALVPIAGQLDSGRGPAEAMVTAIRNQYSAFDANEPKWIDAMLAGKVYYAEANTEIEVLETNVRDEEEVTFDTLPEDPYRFGIRDVVTVRILHKMNLGVPFVSRFFADGENGGKGPGRYTLVAAQATLTNEGVPVPLPKKPEIDRYTPPMPTSQDPYLNQNTNRPTRGVQTPAQ